MLDLLMLDLEIFLLPNLTFGFPAAFIRAVGRGGRAVPLLMVCWYFTLERPR